MQRVRARRAAHPRLDDGRRGRRRRAERDGDGVEHAERFGLSQLHQLRGRVGRGAHESSCVLLYQSPLTDEARERLKAMTETTDGFVIAERDLELRGPGDFFGTRQRGCRRCASAICGAITQLMERARREAVGAGSTPTRPAGVARRHSCADAGASGSGWCEVG